MRYIDYLVAANGGSTSALPLNEYRRDAMRGALVRELVMLLRNHDPAKVPEFMPFAKAMLKRFSHTAAFRQVRAQSIRSEGSHGYTSLDAPLDTSSDSSDATLHDCVADEVGEMRGVRGERLRRFYRVMARLGEGDRRILDALLDAEFNRTLAAAMLGVTCRVLRRRLASAFARFRAIWRVID